jgi:Immunity protein 35
VTDDDVIDFQEALKIANQYLRNFSETPGRLALDLAHLQQREYGWVFVFNTPEFIQTRDWNYQLASSEPFMVLRHGGEVIQFDAALPIEEYLEEYERTHGLR